MQIATTHQSMTENGSSNNGTMRRVPNITIMQNLLHGSGGVDNERRRRSYERSEAMRCGASEDGG